MISLKDVSYSYLPGRNALDRVTLNIGDGELVAIIGENGAGKTTLVKHINGLLKPSEGNVVVCGLDSMSVTVASLARKVGLVFQNPDHQLFAETVEKELSFALVNFGVPPDEIKKRTEWVMSEFELSQYAGRSPFMLSGGERKRLALASVLCYGPEVLILDEPTTGQDNRQKVRMASLLQKLNQQGKTVLVVTHDMEFVSDYIPRVVVMSQGKVIADGPSGEVLVKKDILEKASLVPPQLAEISWELGLDPPSISLGEVVARISRLPGGARP
ncbi:MAG TPA: ATP-binding cassette domain-containing protein [Candidatus Methanomethylicus sp.]|nr:ATP-binding cassette domain-containing protein [Candidatus Methanomethylicus sp.]